MSAADYGILLIIGIYLAYIIFGKKRRSCCGDCGSCRGCECHKK